MGVNRASLTTWRSYGWRADSEMIASERDKIYLIAKIGIAT